MCGLVDVVSLLGRVSHSNSSGFEFLFFVFIFAMDGGFDSLSAVTPGREGWRFRVRVLKIWEVPTFMNLSSQILWRWYLLMRRFV